MSRWSIVVTTALATSGLVACGTPASPVQARSPNCADASGFAVSVAVGVVGQSSPVDAARWFAMDGGVQGIPKGPWHEMERAGNGATVYSGATVLHVIRGTDGTWVVDSGKHCS